MNPLDIKVAIATILDCNIDRDVDIALDQSSILYTTNGAQIKLNTHVINITIENITLHLLEFKTQKKDIPSNNKNLETLYEYTKQTCIGKYTIQQSTSVHIS